MLSNLLWLLGDTVPRQTTDFWSKKNKHRITDNANTKQLQCMGCEATQLWAFSGATPVQNILSQLPHWMQRKKVAYLNPQTAMDPTLRIHHALLVWPRRLQHIIIIWAKFCRIQNYFATLSVTFNKPDFIAKNITDCKIQNVVLHTTQYGKTRIA